MPTRSIGARGPTSSAGSASQPPSRTPGGWPSKSCQGKSSRHGDSFRDKLPNAEHRPANAQRLNVERRCRTPNVEHRTARCRTASLMTPRNSACSMSSSNASAAAPTASPRARVAIAGRGRGPAHDGAARRAARHCDSRRSAQWHTIETGHSDLTTSGGRKRLSQGALGLRLPARSGSAGCRSTRATLSGSDRQRAEPTVAVHDAARAGARRRQGRTGPLRERGLPLGAGHAIGLRSAARRANRRGSRRGSGRRTASAGAHRAGRRDARDDDDGSPSRPSARRAAAGRGLGGV